MNFNNSQLYGASFPHATFSEVVVDSADLSGADLTGVDLSDSICTEDTVFPIKYDFACNNTATRGEGYRGVVVSQEQ